MFQEPDWAKLHLGNYTLDESNLAGDDVLEGAFRVPHDFPPRWLLLLTAYIDESGQDQNDWMFVAGFYGDDTAWRRVAEEWPTAIGPQRKHLHTKRLRFERESERSMLLEAGAVPGRCGLIPLVGGVRQGDFKDIIRGTKEEKLVSGYVLCIWAILVDALRGLPDGERLEIVFEEQQVYQRAAHVALRVFIDSPNPANYLPDGRHKLASWRWVKKKDSSLLELADYFAFALLKNWREPGSRKAQWTSPILDTRDGKGYGAMYSNEQIRFAISEGILQRMVEDAKREMRRSK